MDDTAYLSRSKGLLKLLSAAWDTCEAYLGTGMANVAAANKVNTTFRNAWAKTPPVSEGYCIERAEQV
jgi:hypothetical protein